MQTETAAGVERASRLSRLHTLEGRLSELLRQRYSNRNVNQLHDASLTFGQRVADTVAATMGSWTFIIIQSIVLAVWIALNITEVLFHAWDPYPFILLNLVLSFQAAYAAPVIMMSQNRQAARDRLEAEMDFQTNVKAELLIEELHGNLSDLCATKWDHLLRVQQLQLELLRSLAAAEASQLHEAVVESRLARSISTMAAAESEPENADPA